MKTKKLIAILIICLITILMFMPHANATINVNEYKPSELTSADYYIPFKFARNLLGPIITIGVVISVVMVMVLGIKYMLGSVEEKAEYKKSMWPYVLGAILIFTGSALTGVIYNAFNAP